MISAALFFAKLLTADDADDADQTWHNRLFGMLATMRTSVTTRVFIGEIQPLV